MFTRPIRSEVDTTPKKLPPTTPERVKLPRPTLVGLNSEITIGPATGPGKTSNPMAFALVNVRSNVEAKTFGPMALLGLPTTPEPSTTIDGSVTELYVTPGRSPPSGKHELAAPLLSGPMQVVTPPAPTRPDSKVSTGSPGAAAVNVPRELNVITLA